VDESSQDTTVLEVGERISAFISDHRPVYEERHLFHSRAAALNQKTQHHHKKCTSNDPNNHCIVHL
jgi:hypothetical protein